MIKVHYKNIEKSVLAKEAVEERLKKIQERFPDLVSHPIKVTLDLQNTPEHAGPDTITVSLHIESGRYRGLRLSKSAGNFYQALAALVEHLQERLNRFGDRMRVIKRRQARAVVRSQWVKASDYREEDSTLLGVPAG